VYYQHSSHTKSKTQQLLGRKLTPAETRTVGLGFYVVHLQRREKRGGKHVLEEALPVK